jgi:hypothetical protein
LRGKTEHVQYVRPSAARDRDGALHASLHDHIPTSMTVTQSWI